MTSAKLRRALDNLDDMMARLQNESDFSNVQIESFNYIKHFCSLFCDEDSSIDLDDVICYFKSTFKFESLGKDLAREPKSSSLV